LLEDGQCRYFISFIYYIPDRQLTIDGLPIT
jgi:hypothetical protein